MSIRVDVLYFAALLDAAGIVIFFFKQKTAYEIS